MKNTTFGTVRIWVPFKRCNAAHSAMEMTACSRHHWTALNQPFPLYDDFRVRLCWRNTLEMNVERKWLDGQVAAISLMWSFLPSCLTLPLSYWVYRYNPVTMFSPLARYRGGAFAKDQLCCWSFDSSLVIVVVGVLLTDLWVDSNLYAANDLRQVLVS